VTTARTAPAPTAHASTARTRPSPAATAVIPAKNVETARTARVPIVHARDAPTRLSLLLPVASVEPTVPNVPLEIAAVQTVHV
jgi:hypothetical protein